MRTKTFTTITASAAMLLANAFPALASIPNGYYDRAEGLNKAELLDALETIVGDHCNVGYSALWEVFKSSDVREDGTIWDMYSTSQYTPGVDENNGDNSSSVGVNYNREHSMPKSWFNDASPMYSDAFHIYPTDSRVNNQRSNYPYGECEGGTTLPSANGVDALGRLGTSTFPGYTGTVFEPDDEYKGDFARTYFYMAAAYNSLIDDWSSDQLAGNSYPCFTSWSVEMLMKWHRQDPVSQKEIDRNEVIYAFQNNRNPFIDHPEMAEYIWGDNQDQGWTPSGSSTGGDDVETLQFSTTALSFSALPGSPSASQTVTITALNITDPITVSVTGNFELSTDISSWANQVTIANSGGTTYVRMKASVTEGGYTGIMTMTAGSIVGNNEVALSGTVSSLESFIEDFEWTDYPGSYYTGTFEGNACLWNITGMYLASASDEPRDNYCARLRYSKGGCLEMAEDKANGAGTVSFYGASFNNDADSDIALSYSTDGGLTWTLAETFTLTSGSLQQYSTTLNESGNVRIRLEQQNGDRVRIDDISISNYNTATSIPATLDSDRDWNAYSTSCGQLTLTSTNDTSIQVFTIDARCIYSNTISGTATLSLPTGIYIIKGSSDTQKVIVK